MCDRCRSGRRISLSPQDRPNYIVGDFDKSARGDRYLLQGAETMYRSREFNPVKDATDTEIAVRLGMTLGCSKLIILGATGGRLDHFWANVQTLMISHKAGI